MPVNIEVSCIRRLRPVLQNVHPPGIFHACRHVVGHDVEDESHATLLEFALEMLKVFFRAQFRINPRGVGDVVAVAAALPAAQNRRQINVRDTQIVEVIQDLGRIGETKISI